MPQFIGSYSRPASLGALGHAGRSQQRRAGASPYGDDRAGLCAGRSELRALSDKSRRLGTSGSGMPILMLTAADVSTTRPPGSSSAPTTTSPSRSNGLGTDLGDRYRDSQGRPGHLGKARKELRRPINPRKQGGKLASSNPPPTTKSSMVRRGSTVRVRQRALFFKKVPANRHVLLSEQASQSTSL